MLTQEAEVIPRKEQNAHGFVAFLKSNKPNKIRPVLTQEAEVIPRKERIPTVFEGARVKIYTALAP